jgi:hypothetical protein
VGTGFSGQFDSDKQADHPSSVARAARAVNWPIFPRTLQNSYENLRIPGLRIVLDSIPIEAIFVATVIETK